MDKRPAKPPSGQSDSPESLRNRRRSRPVRTLGDDVGSIPSRDLSPDKEAEAHEHIGLLRDGLARLSEQDREVLRLRYFESWTLSAIGPHLGMTALEVRRRLTATTAALLAMFGPDSSGDFGSLPPLLAPHPESSGLPDAPALLMCSGFMRRYASRGGASGAVLPRSFVEMADRNPDRPLIGVLVSWLAYIKLQKAIFEYKDLYQLKPFTFADHVAGTHFLAERVEAVLIHEGWSEEAQRLVPLLVDSLALYGFELDYLENIHNFEYQYFFEI